MGEDEGSQERPSGRDELAVVLGAELRRAREAKGLSLRELGRRCPGAKRAHGNLSEYENGKRLPRPEIARDYEAVLGLPKGSLVGKWPDPHPPRRTREEAPLARDGRSPRAAVLMVGLVALLTGGAVVLVANPWSSDDAPNSVLYLFRNGDLCRLNEQPHGDYLLRDGYGLDGAIAEAEVNPKTGAKRFLSMWNNPERGVRYPLYVREDDVAQLDERKAEGWYFSGGEADPNHQGLIYPTQRKGTTALWRGRKGRWSYCYSPNRQELQSTGYGEDLRVAGYVWPYSGRNADPDHSGR